MNEDHLNRLNNIGVFKELAEKLKSKEVRKPLGLFTHRNGYLYIWNEIDKSVKTIILNGDNVNEPINFILKPQLYFQVEFISVNSTNSVLCLYGSNGIAVCKLPYQSSVLLNEVELMTDCLAQKVFVCDHHLIRCVQWHPGSSTDSHILLLTSDEVLRLYNALDCRLVWECRLTDRYIRCNLPSKISLGETPVCFDFAPSELKDDNLIFPIYVLWGNGDVCKVDSRLDEINCKIEGLLRYEPSVIDNYGADASSIIVFDTYPPVVAIATCGGCIHHCLLIEEDSENVLHVFETLELELGLVDNSEKDDDLVSCPIRLEKDPNLPSRYFCLHNSGIHSINVSMIDRLSDLNEFDFNSNRIESNIDYLLCTSLSNDIQMSPTLGVAYVDFMKIYILLTNGKIIKILLSVQNNKLDDFNTSKEIEKVQEDDYKTIITTLLKDNGISTFPVVKLNGDIKPSDLYKVVTTATTSLRSVFKCHTEVMLKVQQKVDSLKSHLVKQNKDMEKLNSDRSSLRSTAEQIAEKYEEINEKQNELVKRTEKLLLKIECDSNRSSTASEKKMSELISKAKGKLKQLESDVLAVQSFHKRLETTDTKQTPEKELYSEKKLLMLGKSLKHLGNDISELKSRLKNAKETVEHCQY